MNKRPHSKETEEDIIKLEKEFLSQKCEPSVKIVKSESVLSKISNTNPQTSKSQDASVNLIGQIVTKETKKPESINMLKFKSGFPVATKRETNNTSKKTSIFAQQKTSKSLNFPSKSYILTGADTSKIHQENVNTLSKLTEREILEEQKKLYDTLDPKLIEYLKSKRQTEKIEVDSPCFEKASKSLNILSKSTKMKVDDETINSQCFDNPFDISENWLNFDKIEPEKLQWMQNIKQNDNKLEIFEARFDFKGYVLPYVDEINDSNRSLFHHGEEPDRPGYTIQELFKLCRANVTQQRILSLNTIANILTLNSTGIYDSLQINIPIEQIFFIIRLSVDENIPSILTASLKCLHNLFYSQIDEIALDILSNFGDIYVPMLAIDLKEDDREYNDQQLAELDLVRILVRTNIFIRIRYILNNLKPNTECVIYCLQILIRLARDSENILQQFVNTENFMDSIISSFLPTIYKFEDISENCYNKPVVQCIKLLKILCYRDKNICEILINKYNIINSLISYISVTITNCSYGIKIQNETLKLLNIIFRYNLNLHQFREFDNILLSLLTYHVGNTNLNTNSYTLQTNLSNILILISTLIKTDFNSVKKFIPLINNCCLKYFTQAANVTNHKLGDLQILAALLATLTALIKQGFILDSDLKKIVSEFIKSLGFYKITENIKYSSNLLCDFETHKSSANFKSVEAAVWQNSEHIVPTLNTKSPILFLKYFSEFIETNIELQLEFLQHDNIKKYLNDLKNKEKFNLTQNWFSRCEAEFILNILKCSVKCQNVSNLFLFYEMAVKCLSILTVDNKNDVDFLLKNIIFNKNYIPEDVLINELSLNDTKNVLNYLNEIYFSYFNVLDIKQSKIQDINYTIDIKIGNIIPKDWIYLPIMYLYSKYEEKQLTSIPEVDQVTMVTNCLQLIYFYENYFPNFCGLNYTEKFCRLSCVFLCSNNIFLEEKIQNLLEINFKKLIENIDKLDFSSDIQGLGNFESFYQQLLEQYQGVSYGNSMFANFILTPSIQKQDSKWRKLLWSQYSGAVETVFLTDKNCLINIEEFLVPQETDMSLLNSYKLVLSNKNFKIRCPLLYFVITKHLQLTK